MTTQVCIKSYYNSNRYVTNKQANNYNEMYIHPIQLSKVVKYTRLVTRIHFKQFIFSW